MSKWLEKQKAREAEATRQAYEAAISSDADVLEQSYQPQLKASEFKPGSKYTWTDHDQKNDFYELSRRMNVSVERLMEYNEIEDLSELETGIDIYYPSTKQVKRREVRYEILPEPREMHVTTKGGAKKWAFGNVNTWEDFNTSGFYPENTNINIVAVAHVPINDKKNSEAGFYLDALALGDYEKTGRLRYTLGYRWSDLGEGKFVAEVPESQMAVAVAHTPTKLMDIRRIAPNPIVEEIQPDTAVRRKTHFYVETYQPNNPPIPCMANIPEGGGKIDQDGRQYISIRDFETRRPDRKLYQYQEVTIAGTFEIDGIVYGRPVTSAKNFLWYGIPMDLLQSQEHMYNVPTDVETRIIEGRLTFFEKWFWVPISRLAHSKPLERKTKNKEK